MVVPLRAPEFLRSRTGKGQRGPRAFASPFHSAADKNLLCMTAFSQSSLPGPGPFRFPETIRRGVSGHRKRSPLPTVRRLEPASGADLLPPRPSLRPEASPSDVRPSSTRPWPASGAANADAVCIFPCSISCPVCRKVRPSIFQWRRTIPLNTKYRADPDLPVRKQ